MNLIKNCKVTRVYNSAAAGTSDTLSSSILDMANWDGVMFLAAVGDVTSTATLTFQAQQNTINSASGMATLAGTAVQATAGASDQDNMTLLLDVYRPQERYLRAQLVRGVANLVIDGIWAVQYSGRVAPATHDATTVLSAVSLVSPAEA